MVKKILSKTYVYLVLLLAYAPIIYLIVFSFTDSKVQGLWGNFTFDLYFRLFKHKELMTATKNTFLIAGVSAVISTVLGTLGAIGIFYSNRKMRTVYEMVGQIPVMNPEIVIALSLLILFSVVNMETSFFTLLVGHVVLTVPFVVLSVTPKLKQMDPNIYEAALDLGAKPGFALRKVILPEIMPGIFSGFLLSVTLSLDDFIITAFAQPSSFDTISTFVYDRLMRSGAPIELRALTTIIFVITLGLLIIYNIRTNMVAKRNRSIVSRGAK